MPPRPTCSCAPIRTSCCRRATSRSCSAYSRCSCSTSDPPVPPEDRPPGPAGPRLALAARAPAGRRAACWLPPLPRVFGPAGSLPAEPACARSPARPRAAAARCGAAGRRAAHAPRGRGRAGRTRARHRRAGHAAGLAQAVGEPLDAARQVGPLFPWHERRHVGLRGPRPLGRRPPSGSPSSSVGWLVAALGARPASPPGPRRVRRHGAVARGRACGATAAAPLLHARRGRPRPRLVTAGARRQVAHLLFDPLHPLGQPLLLAGQPAPPGRRFGLACWRSRAAIAALLVGELARLELQVAERPAALVGLAPWSCRSVARRRSSARALRARACSGSSRRRSAAAPRISSDASRSRLASAWRHAPCWPPLPRLLAALPRCCPAALAALLLRCPSASCWASCSAWRRSSVCSRVSRSSRRFSSSGESWSRSRARSACCRASCSCRRASSRTLSSASFSPLSRRSSAVRGVS
jgi:hypothetical protein